MWHEARKQERIIRGMIVDYRRRAERRKDFYEKIKAEPTQFLQLHGRPCKIHLDPAIAAAGDSPAIMMPWQGDTNNMIDRFDVRAHLDYIPEVRIPDVPPEDLDQEERHCNYERYRILAQNTFLGISEDRFLQQLAIEEQFGVTVEEKEAQKEKLNEKKWTGVAIGYNYNDPGAQPSSSIGTEKKPKTEQKDSDDDSDLEIIDVDLSIDVNKMEASQAHELNAFGPQYGMAGCDLFSFLTGDADDAEHQKQLLREEKEKAMFSGRKSRRERRAHRDKKLATRVISPPSYAAPSSEEPRKPSRSPSKSPTPEAGEKIQFITSFGGDEDDAKAGAHKPLYSEKLRHNLKKKELYSEILRKSRASSRSTSRERYRPRMGPHRPSSRTRSRSRSRSNSRSPKRVSRSRSSKSASSRSRSKSYSPRRSRSRSRPRSYRRRSRSPENLSSGYGKRYDGRSISHDSHDKGEPSKPALPRYYGRKKDGDKSSSELSIDSDSSDEGDSTKTKSTFGNVTNSDQNQLRLTGSSSKGPAKETVSFKEKLKRKMQAQLSRQLRADKRAEAERLERESRRQARRDEEMRELAIKLRRKQREMRHQQNRRSSEDSDGSRSGSVSSTEQPHQEKVAERTSRSKSRTPPPKRIPVWAHERIEPPIERPRHLDPRENAQYQDNYQRRKFHDNPEDYYRDERPPMGDNPRNYQNYRRPYDDRPPREYDGRYDAHQNYDSRFQRDNFDRRQHRGGYRSDNRRYGPDNEGSSHYSRDSEREGSGSHSRNRVKLVDY